MDIDDDGDVADDDGDVVDDIPELDVGILSEKDCDDHGKSEEFLPPIGDEKDWEEVRCPICMDHPHNAVLLLCSSCEKGCRPYMCGTGYLQSNCLDLFFDMYDEELPTEVQDVTLAMTESSTRIANEQTLLRQTRFTGCDAPDVLCPLCRGQINGFIVLEDVQSYMNSKARNCSLESCNFSGNYIELREHARSEHPNVKPSSVDPERQAEWRRLESEMYHLDAMRVVEYDDRVSGLENDGVIHYRNGYEFQYSFFINYTSFHPYVPTVNIALNPEILEENREYPRPENSNGRERTDDSSGIDSRLMFQTRMTRETDRNSANRRTGGRSFVERLARRSDSNKLPETTSHGRWNGVDTPLWHR